jgi:hypothetical protein
MLYPNIELLPVESSYIFTFQKDEDIGFKFAREVIVPNELEEYFVQLEGRDIVY